MSDLFFTNDTEWYAQDFRAVFEVFDEGVKDLAGDGLLVEAGVTGLSIDVNPGQGIVQGDTDPDQGKYLVRLAVETNSESFDDGGIPAADATNPRVDRIVARVYDDEVDLSGQTDFKLEVLVGTPTAGADLTNLNGAVALPDSALLLANVLIEAGDTAVDAANIDDMRTNAEPWI